jgi:hypothetical protein
MDIHIRKGLQWALGLGVGLGLMAGALGAALMPRPGLTDDEVVQRARALGMIKAIEMPQAPREAPREAAPAAPKRTVTYAVVPGMSFGEIASLLNQAGVIADEQALIARAREREAMEQVKAGIYTVVLDPAKPVTPDQVLDQLLTGPS